VRSKCIHFIDQQKKNEYKYTATVGFTIYIQHTQRKGTNYLFDAKLAKGLKYMRDQIHMDRVITSKEGKEKYLHIANKEGISIYQIALKGRYIMIHHNGAFSIVK